MINKLKIIGSSIALALSAIWLWEQTEWEPAILVATTFFSLLYYLLEDSKVESVHTDKSLFQRFLKELPYYDSIDFLNQHDFGTSYDTKSLRKLYDFSYRWRDASHEFRTVKLEEEKTELINRIYRFRKKLSGCSFLLPSGRAKIYPELAYNGEGSKGRVLCEKSVQEVNVLADQVVESHQKLVRLGKKLIPDIDISRQEQKEDD